MEAILGQVLNYSERPSFLNPYDSLIMWHNKDHVIISDFYNFHNKKTYGQ